MGWKITKVVLETQFCFGKHNGKSIKWLIDNDFDYITWCLNNRVIKFDYRRRPGSAKIAEDYYLKKITDNNKTVTEAGKAML